MGDININMIRNDQNLKPVFYNDKCDKYDYLIAVFSGLSAGMIDAFFVGEPMSGSLGRAVDRQADQFVMKATQIFWSMDTRPNKPKYCPEAIHSCISYMEQAFPVSYDARYAADLNAGDGIAHVNTVPAPLQRI